jgi:predicted extracellular nuclease/2',3'-cyclic-nucleotide 2'-phosphodiesterase (5'-nucleotidase family)
MPPIRTTPRSSRSIPITGEVSRVAEINQDVTRGAVDENVAATGQQDIGDWESSGILDVSTLFDEAPGTLFLADVQAHALDDQDRFPESLQPRLTDDDLKEGGQLLFLAKDGVSLSGVAEKIGVVGATTPTLGSISSPGSVGISPSPFGSTPSDAELDALAAEIQLEVDALLADNPDLDKVILLAHMQQLQIEVALAERLTDVDVIIAGGSNTRLFDDNDRPRDGDSDQGDYPIFVTNAGGTTTAVVNTDGSYKYVGRLVIDFDADGHIIPESYDAAVSGAYATDAQGVVELSAEALIDPEIQAIVDAIEAQIIATESNVFGVADVFLNGNRSGVADDPADTDGVRTQETNLGNLTADANLAEAQASDPTVVVSIKNGGGIRASIGETVVPPGGVGYERVPNGEIVDSEGTLIKPEGGISQNDIATTLAFNNDLTLLTLTKAELVAVLEHGVSGLPAVAGAFPQVSGVRFSFDPDLAAGSRILSAGIFDGDDNLVEELVRDGVIQGDPDAEYRVVTLGFLAAPRFDESGNFIGGGDGYPFPNTNTDPSRGEVGDAGVIARVNLTSLETPGVMTGDALFADDGTEQDALAEFLLDNFADASTPFDQADTGRDLDERIQNLNFRSDTVLASELPDAPDPANVLAIELADQLAIPAGAEIVDFDPDTNRAFVATGDGITVVDASNPFDLSIVDSIEAGEVTSVSVKNGLLAAALPAANATDNGAVLFYDPSTLALLGSVEVGPLPDMLTFDATGDYLLVANEGQSADGENAPTGDPNPEGSVSIINVNAGDPGSSAVTSVEFSDPSINFASLAAKGVRVNRNAPSAAADLEPEYITIEGTTAFITLQENNAVAVIEDITSPTPFTIDSIQPLGVQNHGRGMPSLETFDFEPLPLLGTDANGLDIDLGGFSGLQFLSETDTTLSFLTVPDRGPNGGEVVAGARTFNLPDYQARVVQIDLDKSTGLVSIGDTILLTRSDGTTPITGLPNIEGFDEIPVDAAGNPLPYDPFGADLEGIVLDNDGSFWMVDEYRPSIYHFAPEGSLIDRFVPEASSFLGSGGIQPPGTFGSETLPYEYNRRRGNRGFEAVAADLDNRELFAFIQTPLENPDAATSRSSQVIRILQLDMDSGQASGEFVYLLEDPGIRPGGRVDKIGDAVFNPETGTLFVVERDSEVSGPAVKPIYEIDLAGATNVLGMDFGGQELEQLTPTELEEMNIIPVAKVEVANPPSLGYTPSDKIEGLALLPDGSLGLLNDNDFGIEEAAGLLPQLGILSFTPTPLDASNRDGAINIASYNTLGLRQPDAIASYAVDGVSYYVVANEGDGRDVDESRGADLVDGDLSNGEVDAGIGAELINQLGDDTRLGRLIFSNVDGDIDNDGDIDQLYNFGARSFSIFDEFGNLVYDSGADFELITERDVPELFNSQGDAGSFDNRSDDKGPEPEGVAIGQIDGSTYAFVGLERVGGIMVYDISEPNAPIFDQYLRVEGDVAPEGLEFIPAADSPSGFDLLAVANEESKTLTFLEINGLGSEPITPISAIQGSSDFSGLSDLAKVGRDDLSPLLGETVTISAVVTADFQDGLGGFFVQEEDKDWDADPFTSEGLFIFDGNAIGDVDVDLGDLVEVTGTVAEFFGQTQISATEITVLESAVDLPSETEVDLGSTGVMLDDDSGVDYVVDLEAFEGMRITIPEDLTISELFNLDRFGEYRVSADGRPKQFTQANAPDADGFDSHLRDVAARSLVLDDASTAQNPKVLEIIDGNNMLLNAFDSFRMGDVISQLSGVVDYSFDEFRLQDATGDYSQQNPRPESPADVGGNFKVATLNVLNYFTTIDTGVPNSGPNNDENPRGADNIPEFERQIAKLVNAIVAMDADILGLVELENDDDEAIADLVSRVNRELGATMYDYIPTGDAGDDVITTGIMYKPASAVPVGNVAVLLENGGQSFLDPLGSGESQNRPAVAQTFQDLGSGQRITVAVNHFKSKGSLTGVAADEDQLDGQGRNNATRTAAAEILADWLANDPTGTGAKNQLIVGDLNAYAQEDPIQALEVAGFTDVAGSVLGDDSYSFVFDGQIGTLDYILANGPAFEQVAGVTEWHINADEADAIDYNLDFGRNAALYDPTTAARASDHDPIIVGLDLESSVGEYGSLSLNHVWTMVDLERTYTNPVVIASDPTRNGADPATVRIRNVTEDSFEIRLQEPLYRDQIHVFETVGYLVVEAGDFMLADGTRLSAGTTDINLLSSAGFETVDLGAGFAAPPTLLTQSQTFAGPDWQLTRTDELTGESFALTMQEEEARNGGRHVTETIGWLAIDTGTADDGDTLIDGGTTSARINHVPTEINYEQVFGSTPPTLLAKLSSFHGPDPANVRLTDLTASGFTVRVAEEQSLDRELTHLPEQVAYLAFQGSSGSLEATMIG